MPAAIKIDIVDDVGAERAPVEALVDAAAAADGTFPLNEAAMLALHRPRADVRQLLARADGALVGYAQLHLEDPADDRDPTAQLVVAPEARRRGVGRALVDRLLQLSDGRLQLWAMGDSAAAAALAAGTRLERVRGLSIMTRPLDDDLPAPATPPGVTIRSFRRGLDEDAWLAVNARAFAHHPEQGRITRADLDDRMAEPWFDPAGFLLAERDGRLIGFHWTKQHPDRLGEVYVIGVDPDAGGGGLGKALLAAGLQYLRSKGNTEVELYVESDHSTAIGLYVGAGFRERSRDVLYRTRS